MATHYSPKIVTDGLVLCLDAGDKNSYPGSGTTWYDLSGGGRNFTWTSTPTFNSKGYFDCTGKSATGPNANTFGITNSSGYTVELSFYINDTALQDNIAIFFAGGAGNGDVTDDADRGISIHLPWSNSNIYWDQGGCCDAEHRTSYGSLTYKTWYNYAFVSEVSNRYIYLNGNLVTTNTTTANDLDLSAHAVTINANLSNYDGWDAFSPYFHVYKRGLSSTEVKQNFNAHRHRFGI